MKSSDSRDVDRQLAKMRSALDQLHAPQQIETRLQDAVNEQARSRSAIVRRHPKWWVPVGIAASLGLIVVGVITAPPVDKTEVVGLAPDPVSGYQVARAQVPMRIHSLSRGAELRYLDTHVIRDERGVTRVVYIQLPRKD